MPFSQDWLQRSVGYGYLLQLIISLYSSPAKVHMMLLHSSPIKHIWLLPSSSNPSKYDRIVKSLKATYDIWSGGFPTTLAHNIICYHIVSHVIFCPPSHCIAAYCALF